MQLLGEECPKKKALEGFLGKDRSMITDKRQFVAKEWSLLRVGDNVLGKECSLSEAEESS